MQTRCCSWVAVVTLPVLLPMCGNEPSNNGAGGGAPTSGGVAGGGTAPTIGGTAGMNDGGATTGGATTGGATTGGSGTGGSAGLCTIEWVVYQSGKINPTNHCLYCDPSVSTVAWTSVADGTVCDEAKVCDTGLCRAKCWIDSTLYAEGAKNPQNPCQSCQPAKSAAMWSNVAEATACGTDQACHDGTCQAACVIGGTYYLAGDANPTNPCQSCQPSQSPTSWSKVATRRCVTAVAVGLAHGCAVVGGGVQCWGFNDYGQLGNGTRFDSLVPVQALGLTSGVTAIAAGEHHTCALVNGGAQCWGDAVHGQLGDHQGATWPVPHQVIGLTSGVTAIACGAYHTCAVVNGGVQCWGESYSQLGNNATTHSDVPVPVQGLKAPSVSRVATGAEFSCASGIQCWGRNAYGQLGNNSTYDRPTPVDVMNTMIGDLKISAGARHACAVIEQFGLCWGANESGQLGDNSTMDRPETTLVRIDLGVTEIAGGHYHSCAVLKGGVQCWGNNSSGQLGNGSTTDSLVPVQVTGLLPVQVGSEPLPVTAIGAGLAHSCAVVDGGVLCWGSNVSGQLGNGVTTDSLIPVRVRIL